MQVKERFSFVDALRGIAALAVVLFHAFEGNHIPQLIPVMPRWITEIIDHGNLGVAIFFVLSGFVIAHSIYSNRITFAFAGRFLLRRSLRLDPPYWVAIILAVGFAFLSAKVVPDKPTPNVSVGQIVAHFLYLQDILGYASINTVFWTLCLEVQYYFIYVFLLALVRNDPDAPYQGKATIAIIVAAALLSLLWPTGLIQDGLWPGSFLPFWHSFLLGVVAYWAWRNPKLMVVFMGFAFVVTASAVVKNNGFSLVSAVTACCLWFAAISGQIVKSLNWSWLQFLGKISYSLYLTHNPITGATFRAGYMLTGHTAAWEAFWWAVSLACCIIFAEAMWRLIEAPSMRLARKIVLKNNNQRATFLVGNANKPAV